MAEEFTSVRDRLRSFEGQKPESLTGNNHDNNAAADNSNNNNHNNNESAHHEPKDVAFSSIADRQKSFQEHQATPSDHQSEHHNKPEEVLFSHDRPSIKDRMKTFQQDGGSSQNSPRPGSSDVHTGSIRDRLRNFENGTVSNNNNNNNSNNNNYSQSHDSYSSHSSNNNHGSGHHQQQQSNNSAQNSPRLRNTNNANRRPNSAATQIVPGSAEDYVHRILNCDESVSWGVFKWEKNALTLVAQGTTDFEDMKSKLDEGSVLYAYMRIPIGSDRRNKYVFIRWVGDNVRPIQRARAFDDCKRVMEIIKVHHLDLPATKRADLVEKNVIDRLQAAAGANYDKEQNAAPANLQQTNNEFGSYKRTSKQFFQQMERNGNVRNVVYETKPLAKQTPVDLGNRQMTAGAAAARANIVDLSTANGQKRPEQPAA